MIIVPVLLAGGYGTRLSPLSQKSLPKQFLQFFSNKRSSFQLTTMRIRGTFLNENILIATNEIYTDIVKRQLSEINETNYTIIAEQSTKNTFPIIASILKINTTADVMFVTPTDLVIEETDIFARQIQTSSLYCFLNQKHILFGIQPESAESNFGYIKIDTANHGIADKDTPCSNNHSCDDAFNTKLFHSVDGFVEKPPIKTAKNFYTSKNYYWNSGMFMFNTNVLFKNIELFDKAIFDNINVNATIDKQQQQIDCLSTYLKTMHHHKTIENTQYIEVKYGKNIPEISIDNAIISNITSELKCMIADFKWIDFGNWNAFMSILFRDQVQLKQ